MDPLTPTAVYAATATGVFDIEQEAVPCIGDCNNDQAITIDELLTLVHIALGTTQPSGCAQAIPDGDEGTFVHPKITADIDEQTGALYTGTLTLRRAGGEPLVQTIEGSVDSAGVTHGVSFIQGVPVPAGYFTGRLVGKILTISTKINDPTCESAAASFIGTRD